ncbi:hypothetical protein ACOSP7_003544 [Xanthoceras sorbifolium]
MKFTFVLLGWEGISQINEQKTKGVRRAWTKEEEEVLLSIVDEIVASGARADCGYFKSGTLKNMETRLTIVLPNCGLKANPYIESKLKFWKKQYEVVYDMLNTSGFRWNDVRKCVEVDSDEVWKSYVQHHKHAKEFRGKHFPLYERLANIFVKDRSTGKMAQTPDQQVVDLEEGDNFNNEFETVENFSLTSMNKSQSDLLRNQAASQPVCRKRSRSGSRLADPMASSMNKFSDVIKEAIDKTTEVFKEFGQILATNKANEHERIAHDLQKMGIRRVDQVRVMKMFVQKPEMAGIFKASNNEEDKFQFIMELLGGEFDD